MDDRGRILFVGGVTSYLLARVFAADPTAAEVVVYGLTAAAGLEFVISSWPSLWSARSQTY
ncbi:MAG: hypothetical protein JW895_17295 [Thermoleophilaceae bacterium]|nr:hypothetical protein [Thermoleophilaceae bacterium]